MSVIPHPHPVYEWSDPPDGFHIEWVEHNGRRVVAEDERQRPCRGSRRCPGQVVMALQRSRYSERSGRTESWWFYCDQHMYGSRLENGKIVSRRLVEDAKA